MKPKRRIAGFLLALCLVAGLLPTTAFAEETGTGKAIQLGTGGISGYDSTNKEYDYIYFGNWTSQDEYTTSGPIKWRVLDDKTNTGETGLFLLSDALLGTGENGGVVFDNSGNNSNAWQKSTAQAWCKDFAGEEGASENVPDAFTAAELGAISSVAQDDGAYKSSTYNYQFSASTQILDYDRVYFLSAEEAEKAFYGLTDNNDRIAYYGTDRGMWWLRSPYASDASKAGVVTYAGNVDQFPVTNLYAARPAFNLGTDAVLFTSAAASGKEDAAVDGNLTAVGAGSNSWKLTLKDTSRSFTVTETAAAGKSGETITLNYSNAKTGTNEYVSILLVNDSDEVLYYGHIANNSESGTASVEIPTGLAEGTYTLKVFSEQCNGDYQTDYASAFVDVTLTVGDIAINDTNFPDANFRAVASGYDKDLSGTLSPEEIAEVIWIDCANKGIESMQGIEFFSALERLYCFKNSLTTLDVSRNTALKMLYCSDNKLTSLDVSHNTALEILGCYNNNLMTSLNVSGAAALKELRCYQNSLTSLDVSHNTALELLHCFENNLTSLNVSGAAALKELYCYENSLTSLDVSHNTALETVYCYNNELTSLDVSGAAALKELQCYENSLTSLNVSGATALVKLDCAFNSLTALDVISNTALEELQCCYNSGLTALDVSHNTALVTLNCGGNSLTALDISNNTALEHLWCQENNLTTLDVSNNAALNMLCWWENNLTSLDITGSNLGGYGGVEASDNIYNIRNAVGTGRTFDLSTLPGNFDVSKASDWNGGTVDGTTLTIDEGVYTVTYTYDCGERKSYTFSLTTLQEITSIEATVTAPVIGEEPADSADFVTVPENAAEFREMSWYKIAEEDYTGKYWFDTWTPMEENEEFQSGYYYRVKLYFNAKEDFGFFKNVIGKVNGRDHDDVYPDVYDYADSSYAYLSILFTHAHEAGDEYAYDENSHWNPCTYPRCGEKMNIADHKFDWVIDKEATATEKGSKHEECTVCGYKKAAVEIPAYVEPTKYTVTFDGNGGTPSVASMTTTGKKLESLPTATRSGYTFNGWFDAQTGGNKITTETEFMADTTVYAQWTKKSTGGGGGSATTTYTVTFETDGGSKVSSVKVTKNGTVTKPTAPTKDGYTFDGWYTDQELETAYDFSEKVTKSFTLYAAWTEKEAEPDKPTEPITPQWKNPFADVSESDWFYNNVKFVNENGLMSGTTETTFAPDATLNRAMLVTVLYRAEGEPAVEGSIPFADVDTGAYFANAVIWAQENGIVNGVTENAFAPDENITREQIAAIMHRYAKYKGYDVSVGEDTNILSYTDTENISEYAISAMQYTVGSGLMKGKSDTTLNPLDNSTRAEIAAILQRFLEANK